MAGIPNLDEYRRTMRLHQLQDPYDYYREMIELDPTWRVPFPPPRWVPLRPSQQTRTLPAPRSQQRTQEFRLPPFAQYRDPDAPIFPPLRPFPSQPLTPAYVRPHLITRPKRRRRKSKRKTKSKSKPKTKKAKPCKERLKKLRRVYRRRVNLAAEGVRVPTTVFLDQLERALF